jgi:O-acetyl-ADP-ribose deacetylase (regulator of RNase III)
MGEAPQIEIVTGNIVQCDVEAVVNAANHTLLGGGGVDGAIHRAAGPRLLAHCVKLGGCPTGEAKITPGFNLKAPWIIHTVGPVWRGGKRNEDDLLARCYRRCLEIARDQGLTSIAFPAISTGAYAFPPDRAAAIALREIRTFLEENPLPERVLCVCFDDATFALYEQAAAAGE